MPLSLRLIREIHAELLKGVCGAHRTPGEFRTSQNWIGPENSTLATATFVPPPPHEMHQALDNLEKFLHDTKSVPTLIHCSLAHAQFQTIHPFLRMIDVARDIHPLITFKRQTARFARLLKKTHTEVVLRDGRKQEHPQTSCRS